MWYKSRKCCPHTRGGEPYFCAGLFISIIVVPTRVGVNRRGAGVRHPPNRCPHTRGGEPMVPLSFCHVTFVVPTRVGVNQFG